MIQVWYVYGLVNNEVIHFAGQGVVICEDTADCVISLGAKGLVIALNVHWSVIV
jgi:hypothetical protein